MRMQILGKLSSVSWLTATEIEPYIRIFSFKFFHHKVLNAFGITIPRHERLDDFNFIIKKGFSATNFTNLVVMGFYPCSFAIEGLKI